MADVPIAGGCRWTARAWPLRFRLPRRFRGLRGYAWAFPCLIDGTPHVNVGVYACGGAGPQDARVRRGAWRWLGREPRRGWRSGTDLAVLLHALQMDLGGAPVRYRAAPIRCFSRTPFTAANVLLVGDAAGAEPLMGEGISFAFEYGAGQPTRSTAPSRAGISPCTRRRCAFVAPGSGRSSAGSIRRRPCSTGRVRGSGSRSPHAGAGRNGSASPGTTASTDGTAQRVEALKAACERLPKAGKPLARR